MDLISAGEDKVKCFPPVLWNYARRGILLLINMES